MSEGREKPRKDFHFRIPQDKRVFRLAGEEGRRRRRRNKYFHPHSLFVAQHLFRSSFSNVRKSLQNRINPSSLPVATPPPWQCVFSGRRMEPLSNRIMLHRINFVTLALLRGELIYSKTFVRAKTHPIRFVVPRPTHSLSPTPLVTLNDPFDCRYTTSTKQTFH